jgi:aryl-alcohol dehydrogenase-like predicted oxidoreductase
VEVVLGCGNFGGIGSAPEFFGRGENREEAFAIMDAGWDLGLRWFDTADAYGGGRSETWIGDWIRARGNRPKITTKTYNPMEAGADQGLSRERVLRQAEASLERLGVERVDLYLAHEPDPETPVAETIGAFETLVERGLVGAFGTSNVSADELREWTGIALVQNSYSLLERGDEAEVIPFCRERGVDYQAFSPLAGGWLTGKYRRGEAAPAGSRMAMRPEPYRHLEDDRVYDALDAFEAAAAQRGVSAAGLALAWALGGATSIVVGPRRPEHLAPVREALALELSAAERDEVGSLFGWPSSS